MCYRHGYNDFFDFKEAVTPTLLELGGRLEPWQVVTLAVDGETGEVFRTNYRPRGNAERLTLTWVSDNLLVLEFKNVRSRP